MLNFNLNINIIWSFLTIITIQMPTILVSSLFNYLSASLYNIDNWAHANVDMSCPSLKEPLDINERHDVEGGKRVWYFLIESLSLFH